MNTTVFVSICFLLIVNVKATNKIDFEVCELNEVKSNLTQVGFKNEFESSSGFGFWNIFKNEYGHFTPSMSIYNMSLMCYCVASKVYSFQGEKSTIGYNNHFYYYRKIPYIGWLNFLYFSSAAIKCQIPGKGNFFIVETEKYYKTPKTRDLFVIEISEADLTKKDVATMSGFRTYIKYPAGKFKAYIPSVDLRGVASTQL